MESDEFWNIIERVGENLSFPAVDYSGNENAYQDALYAEIAKLPAREIVSMELHNLNIWLACINTDKIWAAHTIVTGNQWLEFRAALGEFLMGFGRDKFYHYVGDPDLLLDCLSLDDIRDGICRSHSLGVPIERAWKTVTGLDEHQFIRLECDTHLPIHPEGIEDRLSELCPKLFRATQEEKGQNSAT